MNMKIVGISVLLIQLDVSTSKKPQVIHGRVLVIAHHHGQFCIFLN